MEIRFYNSLTRKTEVFEPLTPGKVTLYSCGPTVYDFAHIGNFRSFLFSDLIRRFLEVAGYEVDQVMNITDVGHMTEDDVADGSGEDRMTVAARRIKEDKKSGKVEEGAVENPDDPYQIARYYTDAFIADGRTLGLGVAFEYPDRVLHATDNIQGMQDLIARLIDKGHAYVAKDGVVYYSVESFEDYGKLSGNTLDQLREGAGGRVLEEDQAGKRHSGDFMLWKPDASHIMKWDSPWGEGYPGWHIECSVMASKGLGGEVIDIHTGGEDLIFPHHECEIAQSCGASGESHFARFWMHARFLLVEGKKMSKRDGSFFTVRDVLTGKVTDRPVHPAVLRYELIKSHYRSNMNFTKKGLLDSAAAVKRMTDFLERVTEESGGVEAEIDLSHPILAEFFGALADDLNISGALGVLHPFLSNPPADAREALAVFRVMNRVLNVAPLEGAETDAGADAAQQDADDKCRRLDEARKQKDFATADALRAELLEAGYDVNTGPEGTVATKKLA